MKISLHWLKEFVEVAAEPARLKADLTSAGLNVESVAAAGDDCIFDIEVTTNRPDCLSHYGVAREVATIYRKRLKRPEVSFREINASAAGEVSIEILNPELCARYCGRVIQSVRVKPSPDWLTRRLEAVGQRPINNVADITNYVLMEFGHPLHAFDLVRLVEHKVVVRRAEAAEHLRTLDGVDRTLRPNDLVIADAVQPIALAGVMGGKESEISSGTHTVLLESAWFDPSSVRDTSKSQGMHTEASHRFERGADIEMAPAALDRAASLIVQLAGGEVLRGLIDVFPVPPPVKHIILRRSEVLRLLGTEVSWEEIERILRSLGFEVERRGTEGWRTMPPSFRLDVTREADLIEEVARHYGYNRLPSRLRSVPPVKEHDPSREKESKIAEILTALGYREIISSSMIDPEENARFTDRPPVILANPLSQENSAMRSSAAVSMVRALRWNLDRDQGDLRFYEFGRVYTAQKEGLPDERRILMLGLTGSRRPAGVHDQAKELDFFDIKGNVEEVLSAFNLPAVKFEPDACGYYEPGASGRFIDGNASVALLGQLKHDLVAQYKLRQKVWLAEVDFDFLASADLKHRSFHMISKYPAVDRDFSLIAPAEVTYASVAAAVSKLGLAEIREFSPVERRESGELAAGKIPKSHVSLLLRVVFQSSTHTLTSDEIEMLTRRIVEALEPMGVYLRT